MESNAFISFENIILIDVNLIQFSSIHDFYFRNDLEYIGNYLWDVNTDLWQL